MPRLTASAVDFELKGGSDLARIAKELRQVSGGTEIRKRMVREIRREAKPLVPMVRRAILALPSKGDGSGLRARMAKAVTLTVRTSGKQAGVSLRVDGRKMPAGQGSLPAYMEGTKGRPWRHPVYGNTDVWVSQSAHPYFYKLVRPYGARARKAVLRVVDSISRDIT